MTSSPTVADGANAEIALGPWTFCAQPPNAITHPDQLRQTQTNWQPALVPGTVAGALRALGQWDFGKPLDADGQDWWFRTTFDTAAKGASLCFDGLATLAEVWINGRSILVSDNMFRVHRIDVSLDLIAHNELVIVFRALTAHLGQPRPRPRWKTNLVQHQQLRWCRTTLLGRIPGWTPPVAPVGPWRAVRLDAADPALAKRSCTTTLNNGIGTVTFQADFQTTRPIDRAVLRLGDHEVGLGVSGGYAVAGTLAITDPPLWWPHTHGPQPLLDGSLLLDTGAKEQRIDGARVGFRQIDVDPTDGLAVKVNGVPVFCRGACWTVADIVSFDGAREKLEHDLRLARDGGVNMLRVGGTMIYESDAFYDLCDELGIMIWQDFMFANMDYPAEDPAFAANIEAEAIGQLQRLARHPSVVIYCGNSEIEQQAAMLGVPREQWRHRWFGERLPALVAEHHPGTAYVPSTPSGGTLPFHTRTGITHYYGVGAYLRPVSDVRRADVKFTPECLGFANVPEQETVNIVAAGGAVALHHPRWKERVPRDTGAGWDFEDVRDHYLKQLFNVDPVQLRSFDTERYLRLSRVVTGELMAQVFAEWRSGHSHNRGALVWFFKDLWPGAGWGIIDSLGIPKAAYYYLKRSWQSRQIAITDEGLDGLHLHVINETAEAFHGFVELLLLKDGHVVVARHESACDLGARTQRLIEADALLDGFYDVAYVYRFGPPKHDVAIATLFDGERRVISEAFHFVQPRAPELQPAAVEVVADEHDGGYDVILKTDRFLRSVSFDAKGYLPDDNYFHLVPGREKRVRFRAVGGSVVKFKAYVEALNLRDPVRIPMRKS